MITQTSALSTLEETFEVPASFAQQRLWLLDQLAPGNATYNIPILMRISGPLAIPALHRSLTTIVERHESLRTTFTARDGQPFQVISSATLVPLPVIDLHCLPADERAAETRRCAQEDAARPFDLVRGPLVRMTLIWLDDATYDLVLTMHHIIFDAWSIEVFFRELAALYSAYVAGRPSPLPELPIQYADFAIWQRDWLQGELLEEQVSYWQRQLASLTTLELPSDSARPPTQTFDGATESILIPKATAAGLQALSQGADCTMFMTLLAAFVVLLYRYSGQSDVAIGSPIANRNRAELHELIGFFVNTLVLRVDTAGNPSFRELLGRVRAMTLAAYAHQDLPFEKLVEFLRVERDVSRSPLFQVAFGLQSSAARALELPGLQIEVQELQNSTSKFDLILNMEERADGMLAALTYNINLFDTMTIRRMLGHFGTLLDGIVADPDQRVQALPLLTTVEREQLLVAWNDTAVPYPQDRCLLQLIEEQIERTPDAVAVVYDFRDQETRRPGDQETTGRTTNEGSVFSVQHLAYRQLNERANQLAHYLRTLRAGPETRIGICVDRSLEMVIGLLGILKAGAAYMPLDPNHPQERLSYILSESQAPILLTQVQFRDQLSNLIAANHRPATSDQRDKEIEQSPIQNPNTQRAPEIQNPVVIYLDTAWPEIAQYPTSNPVTESTNDHLAALYYTSGSTGKPKGVLIDRRGFLNLCLWYRERFEITYRSRVLLMLSFSFDAAFKNMITPLLVGGQMVLGAAEYSDARLYHEIISREQITTLNSTPSLYYPILELAAASDYWSLSSLEYLCLGGEATPWAKLRAWANSRMCRCNMVNIYGPTECSDILSTYGIDWGEINMRSRMPIGRPMHNVRLHVLDPFDNLQPVGLVGELCATGDCLARGFFAQPALTAEKFTVNPFATGDWETSISPNRQSPIANLRLYRTGDLARYLPDGNIELLGRVDQQVKIRGARVELGEIEMMLNLYPTVQECVVTAREDTPGAKRLVAYVVTCDKSQVTSTKDSLPLTRHSSLVTELRDYLKQKLPDYMVPSAFVQLDSLPLSPNGKVDLRALPAPDTARPDLGGTFVEPQTATQQQLARIWASLLNLDQVGIHDSFFALGGHSLIATQVIAQIGKVFQVELPLLTMFEHSTIAELSAVIEQAQQNSAATRAPTIKRIARDRYRVSQETATKQPASPVIVALQSGGTQPPFFCVHPLNGYVHYYLDLAHQLGADQSFYGLQAPGLDGRGTLHTTIEAIAADYIEAMRTVQSAGPYMIGGWSFGGVVAFEMAQQLHRQGQELGLLALFDSSLPVQEGDQPPVTIDDATLTTNLVWEMSHLLNLSLSLDTLQTLKPDDQLRSLWEEARHMHALPPSFEIADLQILFLVFKANTQAILQYVPQTYPGSALLFRARDRSTSGLSVRTTDWYDLITGDVTMYTVPGDHYSFIRQPSVQVLAEKLRTHLSTASLPTTEFRSQELGVRSAH